jgi:23S rRNA G2445 N2-methylase RlmL
VDWRFFLERSHPIHVHVTSIKSVLTSTPAIQGITKKAVVSKRLGGKEGILPEDQIEETLEVFVFLK